MIKSFADKVTAAVFLGKRPRQLPPAILARALLRMRQLDVAVSLDDLREPPSNRLEPLKGNRDGQWSIRINQQWRVCFEWQDGHASNVEIVDYH